MSRIEINKKSLTVDFALLNRSEKEFYARSLRLRHFPDCGSLVLSMCLSVNLWKSEESLRSIQDTIKEASILNVLREREACAKIAESMWEMEIFSPDKPLGGAMLEFQRKEIGEFIAGLIREQPRDFTTLGETLECGHASYGDEEEEDPRGEFIEMGDSIP